MGDVSKESFLKKYTDSLLQRSAALFVGAGLSTGSGYVNWKELLREIATDLGLEIDRERDLLAIAQFNVNKTRGRHQLNQLIVDEFQKHAKLSDNHRLIARLPIHTVWTTNYDTLLEEAYREVGRRFQVKHNQNQLALTLPYGDVTLYKMHGDVSQPDEAVLAKEDYEHFESKRRLFSEALKGDLLSKTFLFLGFSFEDPNIDHILSRILVLMGQNRRDHFCVMRRVAKPSGGSAEDQAEYHYAVRRQALRVDDLGRYGIQVLLVDEYAEITQLLSELQRRCRVRNLFVSGSAAECADFGFDRLRTFARKLGAFFIEKGLNLVSGFGVGIGSDILVGAMESCARHSLALDERLRLFPFPQNLPAADQQRVWKEYRERIISGTGAVIFLAGNKLDPASGGVVDANGVMSEFEICRAFGAFPLPVGATGYVARRLHDQVTADLESFFPGIEVATEFSVLGAVASSDEQLLDAIESVLRKLKALK